MSSKVWQRAGLGGHIPTPAVPTWSCGLAAAVSVTGIPFPSALSITSRCAERARCSSAPLLMSHGRLAPPHLSQAAASCGDAFAFGCFPGFHKQFSLLFLQADRQQTLCCSIFTRSSPHQGRGDKLVPPKMLSAGSQRLEKLLRELQWGGGGRICGAGGWRGLGWLVLPGLGDCTAHGYRQPVPPPLRAQRRLLPVPAPCEHADAFRYNSVCSFFFRLRAGNAPPGACLLLKCVLGNIGEKRNPAL